MTVINIAMDFSSIPGPRYKNQGPHSGEEFREDYLKPAFLRSQEAKEQLIIELDSVKFGYPTSFLEEAFGGLVRDLGMEVVREGLRFESTEDPLLVEEIESYIANANKPAGQGTR